MMIPPTIPCDWCEDGTQATFYDEKGSLVWYECPKGHLSAELKTNLLSVQGELASIEDDA